MALARAVFQRLTPDLATVERDLKVQFNPNKFTLDKSLQLPEATIPGLDTPLKQFVRGQTETLSLELFFDTTMPDEETMDPGEARPGAVTKKTDRFYELIKIDPRKMAPPVCRFVWGRTAFPGSQFSDHWASQKRTNGFQGVVNQVRQEFTLFAPTGVPLRAKLTLSMHEYKPLAQQLTELPLRGSQPSVRTVAQGDTLQSIAAEAYGDSGSWRQIAEANDISDPSSLPVGTSLQIPGVGF